MILMSPTDRSWAPNCNFRAIFAAITLQGVLGNMNKACTVCREIQRVRHHASEEESCE